MFREPDGKLSFARISCTILLTFGLIWGTHVAFAAHAMPDLLGLATLLGVLYGSNKLSTAITTYRGDSTADYKNEGGESES